MIHWQARVSSVLNTGIFSILGRRHGLLCISQANTIHIHSSCSIKPPYSNSFCQDTPLLSPCCPLPLYMIIMEWLGLERTLKTISFQALCHGQGHLPADMEVVPSQPEPPQGLQELFGQFSATHLCKGTTETALPHLAISPSTKASPFGEYQNCKKHFTACYGSAQQRISSRKSFTVQGVSIADGKIVGL